jgi:acyl-CoA thioester hydrolase
LFTHTTTLRVHYALTDQMGVVYYGNYAQFYEIGRTEAIRSLGFTYKALEAIGIMMPVIETSSKFLRPAKYDDLLTIQTSIKTISFTNNIIFHTEIFNEAGKLLNTGTTTLVFIDTKTSKKINMPEILMEKLQKYFDA